jgi:hypothetical protein
MVTRCASMKRPVQLASVTLAGRQLLGQSVYQTRLLRLREPTLDPFAQLYCDIRGTTPSCL